jgi:exodeoxyribonuclease VII large subunit
MQTALLSRASSLRSRLDAIASRTVFARPVDNVHHLARQVDELTSRLHGACQLRYREQQSLLTALSGKLETLSPLGVLGRGYSLTHEEKTGRLITASKQLKQGQRIVTRLADGSLVSTVNEIKKD